MGISMAAAGLAVVAVVVAVPMLGRAGSDVANPPMARALHSVDVINVVFHDRFHGYALQQRCVQPDAILMMSPRKKPMPEQPSRCLLSLIKTADAGKTWQERPIPAPNTSPPTAYHSPTLWAPEAGTLALAADDGRYWTSPDGGETWNPMPGIYDLNPPGKVLQFDFYDRHVLLADSLDPFVRGARLVPASDGSYWTSGCEKGSCIKVTRDLGATWQTLIPDENEVTRWIATVDGQTVYAITSVDQSSSAFKLRRSIDGGVTWQLVSDTMPDCYNGLVLPNGDLVTLSFANDGEVHRIAAGTNTPVLIPGVPTDIHDFYLTGGVIVLAGPVDLTPIDKMPQDPLDVMPAAWISTDSGVSFFPLPVPAALPAS
ncbi:WD40/YVTN/BNR-like repeat-containing protein [Rhizocola hellebori]|uniref:WD40/YVTN/BNR-like repeat-containing protein n=1 Tax=Rhizocola hellebori TaxID=1392758 RepID=UPI001941E674|nr:sialidase family protein [Rhizocola hellebori]